MKKLSVLFSIFVLVSPLFAEQTKTLAPLSVVGSKEAVYQQVGAAAYLDKQDIQQQNLINAGRVLNKVPGVYLRDEEGFGNFPNISLRGAEGTRTEKVTVMEDGVLTSPAPYSAPAAYYFPTISRMSGIEILKGSSQVRFGPQTTGGVINFLSTPIPEESSGSIRSTFGSDQTLQFLTNYGNTLETENGRFGYLVELLYQSSDGFRDIDYVGGDTGFNKTEPMLKMFWEPDTVILQRFEFKVGYTDFEADETYLGLSEADVRATPYLRYPSTQYDLMKTEQFRTYLRYSASPNETLDVESTLYYNSFKRSWYKLDMVSTNANPDVDSRGRIVGRGSLHKSLFETSPNLAVLKGEATGSIGVKDNNRDYEAFGWQNALTKRFETGDVSHSLTAGLRLHYDYIDRFQKVNIFSDEGNGVFSPFRNGINGEEADRKEETFATAVFLEDEMHIGALTLKPGVRGEFLQYDVDSRGDKSDDSLNTWAAGMGAAYDLSASSMLFGGVYRGISTPGPNSYINGDVDVEESLGGEIGYRHLAERYATEVAGFYTDYDNLIGTDAGFGADESNVNAGAATVYGIEAQLNMSLAPANAGYKLPAYINFTYTQAELDTALDSGGSGNIYAGGQAGAALPYIPDWKVSFGVSYEVQKLAVYLDASWIDESFGTAKNLDAPVSSAREGKVDDVLLVDLSASYAIREDLRLLAGVQNLSDEEYISSRLPHGPRTGAPRNIYAGFEMDW